MGCGSEKADSGVDVAGRDNTRLRIVIRGVVSPLSPLPQMEAGVSVICKADAQVVGRQMVDHSGRTTSRKGDIEPPSPIGLSSAGSRLVHECRLRTSRTTQTVTSQFAPHIRGRFFCVRETQTEFLMRANPLPVSVS